MNDIAGNSKPFLSICCLTYNLESVIANTLDSFLMQEADFSFEIIVHDDASTDKTTDILKDYQIRYPEKIRLVLQEENQYAENGVGLGQIYVDHLFSNARGKYIALCDGDDYWTDPHKLQKQVDLLENTPEVSACFTNAKVVYDDHNKERDYHNTLSEGEVESKKVILGAGGVYPTSSLVFKKDAFFSTQIYKHTSEFSSYLAGDTILIYALLCSGRIYYLKEPATVYRRWEQGIFSSIKDNKKKLAARKQRQIIGYKEMLTYIDQKYRRLLKRKISVETLFALRNGEGISRFTGIKDLTFKEWVKWFGRMN